MRNALLRALRDKLMVYDDRRDESERMLEELAEAVLGEVVWPIESAPTPAEDDEGTVVQLYCPEQGGWHIGVWKEGEWRAHIDLDWHLLPTHWAPLLPDPKVPTARTTETRD